MGRLWLVVVLAGCDKVLSLGPITPLPDAPPGLVCSSLAPAPFMCGEFDEAPQYYQNGTAIGLMNPPAGVQVMAPGFSPPNGLWIDAQAGGYQIMAASQNATVLHIDATFEVQIARYDLHADNVGLATLRVNNSVCGSCYASLQIDPSPGTPRLITAAYWPPSGYDYREILPALPASSTWVHFTMSLDLPTGQISTTVGDAAPIVFTMLTSSEPARPTVIFGVDNGGVPLGGPNVGLDDIIATTR